MRNLKLQTQVSIDGYMSGPSGEMDWMAFDWDDALKKYVYDLTHPADHILLGRKLAEGFIPHWASKPDGEDAWAIEKFNTTAKTVFTKTLTTSPWGNTKLARGDLAQEVNALKEAAGGDLIAYGGGTFVSALIERALIDDLHLIISPTALGSGMRVFTARSRFDLVKATPFACGIVVLHYRPKA